MNRRLLLAAMLLAILTAPAAGAGRPGVHQDAPRLTWLTPGFLPPDGLLTIGLRGGRYSLSYRFAPPFDGISDYPLNHVGVFADWTPLRGLAVSWSQQWRSWSGFNNEDTMVSGSGVADGTFRVAAAMPGLPHWLGLAAWGGGNIPIAGPEMGEDAFSPEAGLSLSTRFWTTSQVPEMRLHLSYGRRWNGNEAAGYGVDNGYSPQPWYPQYPDAAAAGGDRNNDFQIIGAGLEFRRGSTSIWLEYSEYQLWRAREIVWTREDQKIFAAGLRWGLEEGWALHADYQVGYQRDEPWITEWYPRQPVDGMTLAVSRQFSVGGRDRDGDGIPDRRDTCPAEPEDRDGFEDEDGCPDLDNDRDGVPDRLDLAPLVAEDFDGYMDGDGMPDPDNDGDGIPDVRDKCPDEPEDFDGDRDGDGCPEEFADRDNDGIGDEDDLCPDSPEDVDGFQDEDGCPDPDNDLDGIDDAADGCPNEPEDYDGDRDSDGCPDLTAAEQAEREAKKNAAEEPKLR